MSWQPLQKFESEWPYCSSSWQHPQKTKACLKQETVGKEQMLLSADCTISLRTTEKQVHLHADNCCGQNKNNCMMQYLVWRALTGRHTCIILSFWLLGTRNLPPIGALGCSNDGTEEQKWAAFNPSHRSLTTLLNATLHNWWPEKMAA